MVKKIAAIASIVVLIFTGCANKNSSQTASNTKSPKNTKLTYSNLVDEATQKELSKILKNNEIESNKVDDFIKNVISYNNIVGEIKTSKTGFTSMDSELVPYDEEELNNKWQATGYDYMDLNCRLTSYGLYKNYIKSESKFNGDNTDVLMDIDTISNNPLAKMSKEDEEKFTNFFSAVPIKNTTDTNKISKAIQDEWIKRKISFEKNSTVSIINVFLHYPETNNVFIGHSGILIYKENELLFLEKYGASMPYQVSKFKDKSDLKKYLMTRLDVDKSNTETAKPTIMENDHLMK